MIDGKELHNDFNSGSVKWEGKVNIRTRGIVILTWLFIVEEVEVVVILGGE